MVIALIVGICIVGFALHQYIKSSLVKGFTMLMGTIMGIAVAFNFYELVAGFIVGYLGAKAYPLAFFLLFMFVFVLVSELANKLLKNEVVFGASTDKFGGTIFGVLTGYLFAGVVLIVIGLLPYQLSWLYSRFNGPITNPPQAANALLNPDGFVAGYFGKLSTGSLSGTQNFDHVHPDYVNQIALDRYYLADSISPYAQDGAISVSNKGVRIAPESLAGDEHGGKTLVLIKVGLNASKMDVEEGGGASFGLAQLRAITAAKQGGPATPVYPDGYVNAKHRLEKTKLSDKLVAADLGDAPEFAFYIPAGQELRYISFKDNIVEEVKLPVHAKTTKEKEETTENAPAADANQ